MFLCTPKAVLVWSTWIIFGLAYAFMEPVFRQSISGGITLAVLAGVLAMITVCYGLRMNFKTYWSTGETCDDGREEVWTHTLLFLGVLALAITWPISCRICIQSEAPIPLVQYNSTVASLADIGSPETRFVSIAPSQFQVQAVGYYGLYLVFHMHVSANQTATLAGFFNAKQVFPITPNGTLPLSEDGLFWFGACPEDWTSGLRLSEANLSPRIAYNTSHYVTLSDVYNNKQDKIRACEYWHNVRIAFAVILPVFWTGVFVYGSKTTTQ